VLKHAPWNSRHLFAKKKRRHNYESLNRRESYIHEKMNASDFFNLWLKKIRLTLVIVAAYRNLDIFGVDVSIFVSSGPHSDGIIAINLNND